MSVYAIQERLQALKVLLTFSPSGKVKLQALDDAAMPVAIELAKSAMEQLQRVYRRSQDLPPCSRCRGPQLAVPTFDGYENIECFRCDVCSGCRKLAKFDTLPRFLVA